MTRSRLLRALMAALAILALALTLVACGDDDDSSADTAADTAAATGGGDIPAGITTVSMPKQLGNPYEEIEHNGVTIAMEELGGTNEIVGPTDAGASSQVPLINSVTQQEPDALIIAASTTWTPMRRPTPARCSSARPPPRRSAATRCA